MIDGERRPGADHDETALRSRAARATEAAIVTRVIDRAFATDPVWAPALTRTDGTPIETGRYWRLFVDGAMRFGTVHVIGDTAAVAVWLPPGASELDDARQAALETLIARAFDPPAAARLHDLFDRFERSRARRLDHAYLSLLATAPEERGKGVGQRLLAEDLVEWDRAGVATYLESTNPANDHRYARAGFRLDGTFRAVRDEAEISAMRRPIGGG